MVLARRGLQGTCGRGRTHPDQVAADVFRISQCSCVLPTTINGFRTQLFPAKIDILKTS
jgi:hypothetical protein